MSLSDAPGDADSGKTVCRRHSLGDVGETFIHRKDAELGGYLRIEERELEGGG